MEGMNVITSQPGCSTWSSVETHQSLEKPLKEKEQRVFESVCAKLSSSFQSDIRDKNSSFKHELCVYVRKRAREEIENLSSIDTACQNIVKETVAHIQSLIGLVPFTSFEEDFNKTCIADIIRYIFKRQMDLGKSVDNCQILSENSIKDRKIVAAYWDLVLEPNIIEYQQYVMCELHNQITCLFHKVMEAIETAWNGISQEFADINIIGIVQRASEPLHSERDKIGKIPIQGDKFSRISDEKKNAIIDYVLFKYQEHFWSERYYKLRKMLSSMAQKLEGMIQGLVRLKKGSGLYRDLGLGETMNVKQEEVFPALPSELSELYKRFGEPKTLLKFCHRRLSKELLMKQRYGITRALKGHLRFSFICLTKPDVFSDLEPRGKIRLLDNTERAFVRALNEEKALWNKRKVVLPISPLTPISHPKKK